MRTDTEKYFINTMSRFNQGHDAFSSLAPPRLLFQLLTVTIVLLFCTNRTVAMITSEMTMLTEKGHCLKSSLYHEKLVDSSIECGHLCLSEYCRCKSINYERKAEKGREKFKCQLNNATRGTNPGKLIPDANFDYFEPRELKEGYLVPISKCTEKSCADLYKKGTRKDGIYSIDPDGQGDFEVRCDMNTAGGGWTVFQRRIDGSVDFYRNWHDYKNGFGDLNGEFWLGLDKINRLSNSGQNVLRVDLKDFEGEERHAQYETFRVADEAQNYTLTIGGFSGDAGDSLGAYHNGMPFSTKDVDNDFSSTDNCAVRYKGAWWYNACQLSNLNGKYLGGAGTTHGEGVNWNDWKGYTYSLKKTEMKIRPSQH